MIFFSFLRKITAVALFLSLWLFWPRNLDTLISTAKGFAYVPDYVMRDVRYVSVRAGSLEIEMNAKDASFDIEKGTLLAKNIVADLYNQKQEKTLLLSNQGEFFQNEQILHLTGDVHSTSPDGFVVTGPKARYLIEKRFFVAESSIHGFSKDQKLKVWGDRAESRIDDNIIDIIGNARSVTESKKDGATEILGDYAKVYRDTKKVNFRSNVNVKQKEILGESEEAEIFYSDKEKAIGYLSLIRDVKIKDREGRFTRSQVAEFFSNTNSIVLSGYPAVFDGDDAVTGDKITLFRSTGVVEVTSTNAAGGISTQNEPVDGGKVEITEEDKELAR
ncbi:MAG: LPS export ABC transporter periplasmic protein LptC [Oligoflexia bacterium]|nr:LPS export ABC transporter periplasmic protein LptC [Oligoflexia bacterium]